MLLVGLTGGIAAGKSTVSAMLAERGAEIIDADLIAREVVLPGTRAWHRIREQFGPDVFLPDGAVDRAALATVVFADPAKLKLLNEITHPAIIRRVADRVEELAGRPVIAVLDAALLIEFGLADAVDVVIVVDAPRAGQLERLVAAGSERAQAEARVAAQLDRDERLAHADLVIDNSGSLDALASQVDQTWQRLRALQGE